MSKKQSSTRRGNIIRILEERPQLLEVNLFAEGIPDYLVAGTPYGANNLQIPVSANNNRLWVVTSIVRDCGVKLEFEKREVNLRRTVFIDQDSATMIWFLIDQALEDLKIFRPFGREIVNVYLRYLTQDKGKIIDRPKQGWHPLLKELKK
ncbi:hypothetical protein KKA15_00390 [Patescibacteria group bacterium]|nr:hypothetical protein [Patescibacteria group bacterium]